MERGPFCIHIASLKSLTKVYECLLRITFRTKRKSKALQMVYIRDVSYNILV